MSDEKVVYLDETKESPMWLQLGPYRINLEFVERYLPVKDEEGTKVEVRYASGYVQQIPVPEEQADRVLEDFDGLAEPETAESEIVVRWGAATSEDG